MTGQAGRSAAAKRRDLRWAFALLVGFYVLASGALVLDSALHTAVLVGLAVSWYIAGSSFGLQIFKHGRPAKTGA